MNRDLRNEMSAKEAEPFVVWREPDGLHTNRLPRTVAELEQIDAAR
jgi:hypothetical protein